MEDGPCGPSSEYVQMFIVLMNVVQSIAIAWLTNRARLRDAAEKRRNGSKH
jgi:hypothetical protein